MNIMKTTTLILVYSLVFFTPFNVQASLKGQVVDAAKISSITVPFIKNEGQIDKRVKFYAKTFGGGTVFVTGQGAIVYDLPRLEKGDLPFHGRRLTGNSRVVLRETLENAHIHGVAGEKTSVTRVNIFKGQDKDKWQRNVPTFKEVSLGEIYKGVTLSLRAHGNNVEKVFTVQPGGDPGAIRLRLAGGKAIKTGEDGRLVVETALGPVIFTAPVAYQEISGRRQVVKVVYRLLSKNMYGFEVGKYDSRYPLVIDPLLASTLLGGDGYDWPCSIAVDEEDTVYIAGWTVSTNFPTTNNELFHEARVSGFIARFDSNLSQLLSATYFSPTSNTRGTSIYGLYVTSSAVYVAGEVGQAYDAVDFPVTLPPKPRYAIDGFVTKLDKNLTTIEASRVLVFQTQYELTGAYSITGDSNGYIYVAGITGYDDEGSPTHPSNEGKHSKYFIVKLDSGLGYIKSAILGGDEDTQMLAVAYPHISLAIGHDGSGNTHIFASGNTAQHDFPTTQDVYQGDFGGGTTDVFIVKLDDNLNILASTLLGGNGQDTCNKIAVDTKENVYIGGTTSSDNFIPTNPELNYTASWDGFIAKLDGNLSTLSGFVYLGGWEKDYVKSIALAANSVYATGTTISEYFPVTKNGYDTSYRFGSDVFISKLDTGLSKIIVSTFLGGGTDYAYDIALDSHNNIYVTGITGSSIPTTEGAYDRTFNGSPDDVFVSKLDGLLGPAGTISGRVTDNNGHGIPGVKIAIYNHDHEQKGFATTDSNGTYSVTGLATGFYKIYFDAHQASGNYVSKWYNDKKSFDTAKNVRVSSPDTTSDINATLKHSSSNEIFGDVSGDGTLDIVDALFIARHAVGLSVNNFNEDAADVNCDGQVDIVDALFVARKAVGLTVNGWCGN